MYLGKIPFGQPVMNEEQILNAIAYGQFLNLHINIINCI